MFILIIFVVFCIWWVYATKNEDGSKPVHSPPLLVQKDSRRLQLEATIRKIAGGDVSEEKMNALTLEAPSVLVTARAGVGKTTTIALRTALEINRGVRPEQTLCLCFNRVASKELGTRLVRYGAGRAPASTFHALAYAIVRPKRGSLICGERQSALMRHLLTGNTEKQGKEAEDEIEDLLTFISSCKHKGLGVDELMRRCGNTSGLASQAVSIYAHYTKYLKDHRLMDFNDLIEIATIKLNASSRLPVVRLNGATCDLNALRLLAVDEFQDFSLSFFTLVKILMDKNSSMGTYCVGDDWQAINAFAGSDLSFFNQFESYFPGAKRAQLQMNYRSCRAVVDYSNQWMKGLREGGIAMKEGGIVERVKIPSMVGGLFVHQIVREMIVKEPGRSVMVLARRNVCHGNDLEAWQKELSGLHSNVRVSTIHRAKGSESDTVFYLKEHVTNNRSSHLNAVFGITEADVLAEERRIAYVALTRARDRIVVIE